MPVESAADRLAFLADFGVEVSWMVVDTLVSEDFSLGAGDWYGRFGGDYETAIAAAGGVLSVTADGGDLRGAQLDLAASVAAGASLRLSFDLALSGAVSGIEAGLLDGHNGVFSSTPANYGSLGAGHHVLDFTSGGTAAIAFLTSGEAGGFTLDNVVLEQRTAAPAFTAIFDNGTRQQARFSEELPVLVRAAQLTLRDEDLPAGAAIGDAVSVGGTGYFVRAIMPDGTGMTIVSLERDFS